MRAEMPESLKKAVEDYKQTRDDQSFNIIYEGAKKYIYVCIRKVTKGNYNEDDLVQDIFMETMLEVSRNIEQNKETEAFLSWAGMIATRKCFAYFKKNRREVLQDNEENDIFEEVADDETFIPENIVDNMEKQKLIRDIIETKLSVMQKICVTDYYYNDMKQSEIAENLGISENTVKTNLSRAKAKIKEEVLKLEKDKDTKLYSLAPFMLLLFKNEIETIMVPEQITKSVLAACGVAKTGTVAGKSTLMSKIASLSLKAKIVTGVVGVATVGAIGTAVILGTESAPTWESTYKEFLLSENDFSGFDINDFDGDGIPELVVEMPDNEGIQVFNYNGVEIEYIFDITTHKEEDALGVHKSATSKFGYGMNDNEIIKIEERAFNYEDGEYHIPVGFEYTYQNGNLEPIMEMNLLCGVGPSGISFEYLTPIDGEKRHLKEASLEEGVTYLQQIEKDFNEIMYTEIESKAIDKRFEEFKKNGNLERKSNENITTLEGIQQEIGVSDGVSEQGEVVELTKEENEKLSLLTKLLTLNCYSESANGYTYDLSSEDTLLKFVHIIANFTSFDKYYLHYLPNGMQENAENQSRCTMTNVQDYLQNVFKEGNLDLQSSSYSDGNDLVFPMSYSELGVLLAFDEITKTGEIYTIKGKCSVQSGEFPADEMRAYEIANSFTLTVENNENSPFGFKVNSLQYGPVSDIVLEELKSQSNLEEGQQSSETVEQETLEDSQCESVLQMLKAAENEKITHWHMNEDFEIWSTEVTLGAMALNDNSYYNSSYRYENRSLYYEGMTDLGGTIENISLNEKGELVVYGISSYKVPYDIFLKKSGDTYTFEYTHYYVSQSPLGQLGQ